MVRKNQALLQLMESLAQGESTGTAVRIRAFEPGHRLIRQGQEGQQVYIIRSGIAKCFITEENDRDYILEFLGGGEMLGEIEAIRGERAICSVEAITELQAFVLGKGEFLHFMRTLPAFNEVLIQLLATRVSDTSIRGARNSLYTLSEILPQLQQMLEGQQIRFTKQDLAEYMGISIRSLNRLLKEQEG